MLIKLFCAFLITIVLLGFAPTTYAQLSLRINGDVIAAEGDVEAFLYSPGSTPVVRIDTFHKDIRCMPAVPQPDASIMMVLDQISPNEENASYAIPLSGSISYLVEERIIDIESNAIENTSGIDCVHKFPSVGVIAVDEVDVQPGAAVPGAIAVNGFERMFDLRVEEASSGVGFDLFLENRAPLFAAKQVRVPLQLELTTGLFPQPGPEFTSSLIVDDPETDDQVETEPFGTVNLQTGEWELPALWSSEIAVLKVRYTGLQSGDQISSDVGEVVTQDREATLQTPLVTVLDTSTTVSVK